MTQLPTKITAVIASAALAVVGIGAFTAAPADDKAAEKWKDASFYSLKTKSLDDKAVDLKTYEGKVCLVVNVASKCGNTPQYAGLEKLYGELKDKGFVVLGFPSNDFGGQEPGTPDEIKAFCTSKYNVTFPMFNKVQTKAGEGQSEIYSYLGARTGSLPSWNFGKYLIGKDGKTITYFASKVAPDSKDLREAIEKAMGEGAASKPATK
ncbi:MAG: glutathione peroxidase [Phycisphaerae bacterium]|nr:glutathione peroxidase [Phycisphaerae bacterium]